MEDVADRTGYETSRRIDCSRRLGRCPHDGGLAAAPMIANADPASTFFYKDEETFEESQMPSKGKLYVNGAFVVHSMV